MTRNKLIIIAVIVLGIIVLLSYIFLGMKSKTKLSPKATIIPGVIDTVTPNRPQSGQTYQKITTQEEKKINRDYLVSLLINKLPYSQKEFSLDYALSSNQFILIYRKGQKEEAMTKLKEYLNQNQIENISWLYNLDIEEY